MLGERGTIRYKAIPKILKPEPVAEALRDFALSGPDSPRDSDHQLRVVTHAQHCKRSPLNGVQTCRVKDFRQLLVVDAGRARHDQVVFGWRSQANVIVSHVE